MNNEVKSVYEVFSRECAALQNIPNDKAKVKSCVDLSDDMIYRLRQNVDREQLTTRERIELNRDVFPEIIALRFSAIMRYQIETNMPAGPDHLSRSWLEQQLAQIKLHRELNAFYYQYYKTGSVELDELYFAAGKVLQQDLILAEAPVAPDIAPAMSTVFARFRAEDLIEKELIGWLKGPEPRQSPVADDSYQIRWTGDIVNLVELIYGLHLTGQINNGNLSMNDIVRWAEHHLGVSIGIIQRKFSEIQRRKRLSPTKYIDQLKDAVLKKIEEGNA
jgi:hypothetical protein